MTTKVSNIIILQRLNVLATILKLMNSTTVYELIYATQPQPTAGLMHSGWKRSVIVITVIRERTARPRSLDVAFVNDIHLDIEYLSCSIKLINIDRYAQFCLRIHGQSEHLFRKGFSAVISKSPYPSSKPSYLCATSRRYIQPDEMESQYDCSYRQ